MARTKYTQKVLRYGANEDGRGGCREGAGRKRSNDSGISHQARPAHNARHPVHITLKLKSGLPALRTRKAMNVIAQAFLAGKSRFGFRLNHYSIQNNHLHLIVEAADRTALSRGMRGLGVRIARGLNRLWGRSGSVLKERYHEAVLTTPKQVRNVLAYVLKNAKKHGHRMSRPDALDPFSSGAWFDGWRDSYRAFNPEGKEPLVTRARTWLLTKGWRRHGLVPVMARG